MLFLFMMDRIMRLMLQCISGCSCIGELLVAFHYFHFTYIQCACICVWMEELEFHLHRGSTANAGSDGSLGGPTPAALQANTRNSY